MLRGMLGPVRQEAGNGSAVEHHDDVDTFTFDVGVVFVHGIGSQARGATLLSWAEPLFEVLSQVGPRYGFSTRVGNVDDLVGDAPEITLEIAQTGSQPTTWLLSEARWAEAFHPSRASDVLLWAVRFSWRAARRGLAALVHQFWFSATKRLWPQILGMIPAWDAGCAGSVVALVAWIQLLVYGYVCLFVMIVPYLVLFCVLFLLAPLMLCAAVVGILALIVAQRIPVLGKKVSPLVADLVTSVGDAQAYRDREIQAAAMRQVLLNRVADASRRSRSVVVVAHSQGAAIACRTFLARDAPWPTYLVTVGAATSLLNEENSVGRWQSLGCPPWINIWSARDLVPAGPMGDSPKAVRSRWLETLWHYTVGGFVMRSPDGQLELAWREGEGPDCWSGSEDLVRQARNSRGRRTQPWWGTPTTEAVGTSEPVTEWLNRAEAENIAEAVFRQAGSDRVEPEDTPIPRVFNEPGPEEWPVSNRWSIVSDHTTYSTNLTQVQYPLAHLLLSLSEAAGENDGKPGGPSTPFLPSRDWQMEATHVQRVQALAMSRVIAAVCAAAVVDWLLRRNPEHSLSGIGSWVMSDYGTGVWILDRLGGGLSSLVLLVAVALATFAAFSGLLRFPWQEWHRRESLRTCTERPSDWSVRLGISGHLFVALCVSGLIFSSVYWGRGMHVSFADWRDPRLLLIFTYIAWVALWPFFGMCARAVSARPGRR
ncbi:hypothetical protein ACFZBM_30530 [Streptomyces lavendulae]|uniref:Uncharacterized protein n=1 Tax=Streptomyces lavendulae subsp. lavendulae TaxID=58340 RepID=A0A2K8PRB2_STRLA|nr:hypothetical protein SLAV_37580 [Streptomyces lavendulae subsp. lavendulae]QUQ59095.1 hypothetical protein SLLC_35740 [Streptomyces lavendulae subsp. lavendulae]